MRNSTSKIKPSSEWINPKRTDYTGKCVISKDHYFRQESNRVLHVADGIVNTFNDNHLEEARRNWGDVFDEIPAEEFEKKLQEVLNSFYE